MPGFSGTILLPGESGSGLHATAYVEPDRLTLSCAAGQLGAWSLSQVAVERKEPDRFVLRLEGEEVVFLPEEPEGFARLAWVPDRIEDGDGPPPETSEEIAPEAADSTGASEEPADPFESGVRLAEPEEPEPIPEESEGLPPEAAGSATEAQPVEVPPEEPPPTPEPDVDEAAPARSLISESAATIGLVVLLAVLGAAGAALLLGSWSPFGSSEAPAGALTALPVRTDGDLGFTAGELRTDWNRAARRIGSDLRVSVLAVETRPEGEAFRYSFGRHLIVTGMVDSSSDAVRQVSVVGEAGDAFEAVELVEAWHVLLAAVDDTLDETGRLRILHELGAFSSSSSGGTVVFEDRRYTFVDSPVLGAWLTVSPAD